MTRILLLNPPYVPGFCRSARWACRSKGRVQRHPDFMLIAAAVLEKAGHKVSFIDGAAAPITSEGVERELVSFQPDITVLHTTTPSIDNDLEWARFAKESTDCLTVAIGPHVSAVPDDTLARAGDRLDAIARGEYDYTLRTLAEGLEFQHVLGLSFREGGSIIHNEDRPLLDVNELPFPAWHHIQPEWYHDGGKRFPFLTLISGRGCPGACTFCRDTPLMYKHKLRLRSPNIVVDEMENDFRIFPQIKEIMFETDTFTADAAHVRGICEEIISRGRNMTWSCNVRVDLDLSLLPLMRSAGCRMLMVGFEFGTQQSLDAVNKGITIEQSQRFAAEASDLGFTIHGCFMIGAPGETHDSARKTIEFAKSLPLDSVQFSGICTYPGTPLYDWAKRYGYLVPKQWSEWVSPDYEQVTLLDYPQLRKKQIDYYIDLALREFYFRPSQVARMVTKTRSVADVKRKVYGLRSLLESQKKGGD